MTTYSSLLAFVTSSNRLFVSAFDGSAILNSQEFSGNAWYPRTSFPDAVAVWSWEDPENIESTRRDTDSGFKNGREISQEIGDSPFVLKTFITLNGFPVLLRNGSIDVVRSSSNSSDEEEPVLLRKVQTDAVLLECGALGCIYATAVGEVRLFSALDLSIPTSSLGNFGEVKAIAFAPFGFGEAIIATSTNIVGCQKVNTAFATTQSNIAGDITNTSSIVKISYANGYALALSSEGTIFGYGKADEGQLPEGGNFSTHFRSVHSSFFSDLWIEGQMKVVDVVATSWTSWAIVEDQNREKFVYYWGQHPITPINQPFEFNHSREVLYNYTERNTATTPTYFNFKLTGSVGRLFGLAGDISTSEQLQLSPGSRPLRTNTFYAWGENAKFDSTYIEPSLDFTPSNLTNSPTNRPNTPLSTPNAAVNCPGNPPSEGNWYCDPNTRTRTTNASYVLPSGSKTTIVISGPITIIGDLVVPGGTSLTISIGKETISSPPRGPLISVSGCAYLNSQIEISLQDEETLKALYGKDGKLELEMISSNCSTGLKNIFKASKQKGCKKFEISGQKEVKNQVSEGETRYTLVATLSPLKGACYYWWVILICVLALVAIVVAIILIVIYKTKIIYKIAPWHGSN